ncbi:MAG: MATE family efflux transporter [Saprospiraceae bacterium]
MTIDKCKEYLHLIKEALQGKERDYTIGSIPKAIILLAIPMILELSLEGVFALVDMYFVGKLGQNAIAVIGYTESMITLVYSVAIGLSTAATAIIARRVGEKDFASASKSAVQAIIVSVAISLVVSFVGWFYAESMLRFMGATMEVITEGTGFMRIMFVANIVIILLFLINGIFRGAGNAALAMKSLWIASILNIILDPLMIYGLGSWDGMGLEGAAIATCIGRGSGVVYQIYHLLKGSGIIKIRKADFVLDLPIIKSVLSLSWPATFQFVIASGSWIVLTKFVAEMGGTEASAGYQIAIRNIIFFILPAWGLSNAAATLTGQNLGAGNPDRAEKSVIIATKYNAFFMACVSLIFIVLARPIIGIFTDEIVVLSYGISALQIIGGGFIFYGIGMVMIQALNGAGDTRTPTWINFIGFWLFQIPLAYVVKEYTDLGMNALFAAVPMAEACIALAAFYYFMKGNWKKISV